jgi:hypothetical protein
MNKKITHSLLMAMAFIPLLLMCSIALADAPRMSIEELSSRLGDNDIVIIDVRTGRDWEESDSKIRGAVREDPQDVASWARKYPREKTLVLYCA